MKSDLSEADLSRFTIISSIISNSKPYRIENIYSINKIHTVFLSVSLIFLFIPFKFHIINKSLYLQFVNTISNREIIKCDVTPRERSIVETDQLLILDGSIIQSNREAEFNSINYNNESASSFLLNKVPVVVSIMILLDITLPVFSIF